jgi:hypothetical protein
MTEHTWEVETIDGGHMGDADCWSCIACGCAGGPIFWLPSFDRRSEPRPFIRKSEPRPFIPGPALDLSNDCEEAKKAISAHVHGRLDQLENLASKGLSPKYARRIRSVIREVEAKPELAPALIDVVRLLYDVESYYRRPSMEEVEDRLRALGFAVEAP